MHHSTVSIIMSTTCLNVVRISERQLFMNYIDALREASIKAPSHLIIHEVSSLIRIKYFVGTSLIIKIAFQIQILYLFIISRFIYTYSIYICSLAFDMACILILMMSSSSTKYSSNSSFHYDQEHLASLYLFKWSNLYLQTIQIWTWWVFKKKYSYTSIDYRYPR